MEFFTLNLLFLRNMTIDFQLLPQMGTTDPTGVCILMRNVGEYRSSSLDIE
jgi:hypothetical protein